MSVEHRAKLRRAPAILARDHRADSFSALFARPSSVGDILKPRTQASPECLARFLHALKELRVILESVLEPGLLRPKPDQHAGRAAVPRDHDLLVGGQPEVSRKIILHLGQGHAARLA